MNEKLYKAVQAAGIWNIVVGIIVTVTGIVSGILMLINGVRLLKSKRSFTF